MKLYTYDSNMVVSSTLQSPLMTPERVFYVFHMSERLVILIVNHLLKFFPPNFSFYFYLDKTFCACPSLASCWYTFQNFYEQSNLLETRYVLHL